MLWSHFNDLFAPAISIPAPSDATESTEPLATVINLSAILNSEVWISVAEPKTVKLPVTCTSPVKSPSLKITLSVVEIAWLEAPKYPHWVELIVSEPMFDIWVASALVNATPCTFITVASLAFPLISPPIGTWEEPLTTVSVFNLVFTLASV